MAPPANIAMNALAGADDDHPVMIGNSRSDVRAAQVSASAIHRG
jgi:hypothetical protein